MGAESPDPISFIHAPDRAELPEAVAAVWDRAAERAGYVSNLLRAYSLRPGHLLAWQAYADAIMADDGSRLDAAEREIIAVAVSALNRSAYGLAAHVPALRARLDDAEAVHQLAHNPRHARLTPRREALVAFAAQITEAPEACAAGDVQRLRDAGLDDEEIFDAAELAAFINMANRLAAALGWRPNRERLEPAA